MATMGHELFDAMATLYGSQRTSRLTDPSRYTYTQPLNDFGLTAEIDALYQWDDDGRAEVEILAITYRSADGVRVQQMPLAMFSESALAELRDEIAGEIECENDARWGA
ncbi:MAG: hypothetical protein RL671_168 [Pseudomonadota bacterium]|jgi:hypothetical protein